MKRESGMSFAVVYIAKSITDGGEDIDDDDVHCRIEKLLYWFRMASLKL